MLIIRPLLRLLFGVNVVGRENLDGVDRFIMAANHNSHLDIFLLLSALPPGKTAKTHPVAARDYFEKPAWLFGIVQFLLRPIWVDRNNSGLAAIKEMQRRLDDGCSIIIFPEGTRGQAGELQDFRGGVGLIARQNPDIPVVPVYLEGPERAFPKDAAFPLPLWNHITIGPPQLIRGKSREITSALYRHLKTLADEEQAYRQRRQPEPHRPFVAAVIGIDGSGKSTLSRRVIGCFKGESCFVGDGLELFTNGEPHDAQPLTINEVRKWMGRQAKSAKNLARYKMRKLAELLLRDRLLSEVERWYRPDHIFMDGSPLLNMTAWAMLFHEEFFNAEVCSKALDILSGKDDRLKKDPIFEQFPELKALRKLNLNHLHLPDAVIFLDVDPEVSMQRIASRGEAVQAHENTEKLTKLRAAYHLVCDVLEQSRPVCRLSGDKSLEQLTQEAAAFIKKVGSGVDETD
ncbi:MAG: 1-acyl-sn-glycerol-3-phosphate acyltransferase [Verrucomicrobia bacterium]|nr:1-acyl-sn-glycerol-3-phosphate acyltransferase [Verrucomicrobiota bacterium]